MLVFQLFWWMISWSCSDESCVWQEKSLDLSLLNSILSKTPFPKSSICKTMVDYKTSVPTPFPKYHPFYDLDLSFTFETLFLNYVWYVSSMLWDINIIPLSYTSSMFSCALLSKLACLDIWWVGMLVGMCDVLFCFLLVGLLFLCAYVCAPKWKPRYKEYL